MSKFTPVQLQQNLGRVNYPASKNDLIRNAEEYGADEKVLKALKKLPQQQYDTIAAVDQALSQIVL